MSMRRRPSSSSSSAALRRGRGRKELWDRLGRQQRRGQPRGEDLRRLFVNACYDLTGQKVPAMADVTPVGEFKPQMFGFNKFTKGVKVASHELK